MIKTVKEMVKQMGWFLVLETIDEIKNECVYIIEDEKTGREDVLNYGQILKEYEQFNLAKNLKGEW